MAGSPLVKCYLVVAKESHQGTGGGFNYVRLFHLVVENNTSIPLRAVTAQYRLMKGQNCVQEDALIVGPIAPGAQGRSETFIRESAVYDEIEWANNVAIEADQPVPRNWIKFNRAIPGPSKAGCAIVAALLAGTLAYLFIFRS